MDVRKSNVYTKTGDQGKTSLVGGKRVLKSDHRLDAYGTIDELNSFIGLLICEISELDERVLFTNIQKKLFTIGSMLATEDNELAIKYGCQVELADIQILEKSIDSIDSVLPRMKHFVLPGGAKSAALAHVCRTVCRRAERHIIGLIEEEEIQTNLVIYINRLSDLLFVFARKLSLAENSKEIFWNSEIE